MDGPEGDPATYLPDLWRFLVDSLGVKSVLDIGCGAGAATRFFRELECFVTPIDGVDTGLDGLIIHDYTTGPSGIEVDYDLAWVCEVVEHIEVRFLPKLAADLAPCKTIAMTHAFPGQQGHHHVNCRTQDYWLGFFAGIGFMLDAELTRVARGVSAANTNEHNHFLRSGMILRRA